MNGNYEHSVQGLATQGAVCVAAAFLLMLCAPGFWVIVLAIISLCAMLLHTVCILAREARSGGLSDGFTGAVLSVNLLHIAALVMPIIVSYSYAMR